MEERGFGLQSAKELWVLVSGRTIPKSHELVRAVLRDNAQRLLLGTRYYTERWSQTQPAPKDEAMFLDRLSECLQVSRGAAYNLLCSFLLQEYRGTNAQLKEILIHECRRRVLLDRIWQYYRRERLYALACLRDILTHRRDALHPYRDLYDEFLRWLDVPEGTVAVHAVRQLEDAIAATSDLDRSIQFALREQQELLHILLAYFSESDLAVEQLVELLQLFQKHRFGARQPFRVDRSHSAYLGFLEVLVILQGLRLPQLAKSDAAYSSEMLEKVDAAMQSLGTIPEHGPIVLSWMVVWMVAKRKSQTQLAVLAQKLKPFQYLARVLSSEMPGGVFFQDLARTILTGLLEGLLSEYEFSTISDLDSFYTVLYQVLESGDIATRFWNNELGPSMEEFLRADLELFPLRLSCNLRCLKALAQACKTSCARVVEFLSMRRLFIERLKEPNCLVPSEASTICNQADHYPYGESEYFLVFGGTEGRVLLQTEEELVVKWNKVTRGWEVCNLEVRASFRKTGGIENVRLIAELMAAIARTSEAEVGEVEERLVEVLPRLAADPYTDLDAVAACLQVAATCAARAWPDLSQGNLLPFLQAKPKSMADVQYSPGLIGRLITDIECFSGTYSICKAFLVLVLNTLGTTSEQDVSLQGCLIYILREVFPRIYTAKYEQEGDKKKLLLACLKILHKVLTTLPKDSFIYYICFSILHYPETCKVVLKVVEMGEDNLDVLYEEDMVHIVGLTLAILTKLPLLDSFIQHAKILVVIAYYSFQNYSLYLAKMALGFLTAFAGDFPRCLLAYLGADAVLVKDQLLYRLNSLTEDVSLKVALLEFLMACAAKQPGVLELFVTKDDAAQEEVASCLIVVEGILRDKRNGAYHCPTTLYAAAVGFIHALWAWNQTLAVDMLKRSEEFWTLFIHPIQKDRIQECPPTVAAHVISTLALELFHDFRTGERVDQRVCMLLETPQRWPEVASRYVLLQASISEARREVDSLLASWQTFLDVWLRCPPRSCGPSPELLRTLTEQVLTCLATHLDKLTDSLRVPMIEISLYLFSVQKQFDDAWLSLFDSILSGLSSDLSKYSQRVVVLLLAITTKASSLCPKTEEARTHAKQWVRFLLAIFGSLNFQAVLKEDGKDDPRVLCLYAISTLIQRFEDNWAKSFQDFRMFTSLANLLSLLLSSSQGWELVQGVTCLFISVSVQWQAASDVAATDVVSHIVVDLDSRAYDKETLQLALRLVVSLLGTLGSFFFEEALSFVMVLLGKLTSAIVDPNAGLDSAFLICVLVHRMAAFKDLWREEHAASLDGLQDAIGIMLNKFTAHLSRPGIFQELFGHPGNELDGQAVLRTLAAGLSALHALATDAGTSMSVAPALGHSFAPPSTDEPISYGTVVYLSGIVTRLACRTPSHPLALPILEKALHLAFSQSFHVAAYLSPAQRFLFQREFQAEMLSLTVVLQAQAKKDPQHYQFLKVMCDVIEKIFE